MKSEEKLLVKVFKQIFLNLLKLKLINLNYIFKNIEKVRYSKNLSTQSKFSSLDNFYGKLQLKKPVLSLISGFVSENRGFIR
jgi:hypothetical protein